jgi:hypothetical protein
VKKYDALIDCLSKSNTSMKVYYGRIKAYYKQVSRRIAFDVFNCDVLNDTPLIIRGLENRKDFRLAHLGNPVEV